MEIQELVLVGLSHNWSQLLPVSLRRPVLEMAVSKNLTELIEYALVLYSLPPHDVYIYCL